MKREKGLKREEGGKEEMKKKNKNENSREHYCEWQTRLLPFAGSSSNPWQTIVGVEAAQTMAATSSIL